MKIRNSFVSNSSSTSFLLARKVGVSQDPYIVHVSFDFDIREIANGNSLYTIKTLKDWEEYVFSAFADHMYYSKEVMEEFKSIKTLSKSFQDLYYQGKTYIESGYMIFQGRTKDTGNTGENSANEYLSSPNIKAKDLNLFFIDRDYSLDILEEDDEISF